MASKPPEQARGESSAGGHDIDKVDRDERYGPLALERRVKDDGRALLLYSREPAQRP